jgi:hypothetical protein
LPQSTCLEIMISSTLHHGLGPTICRKCIAFQFGELTWLMPRRRVSARGTEAQDWDRNTWPPLFDLAKNYPEAGVHFQRTEIYNRNRDVSSSSAASAWFAELVSPNPWFSTLFDDVSLRVILLLAKVTMLMPLVTSFASFPNQSSSRGSITPHLSPQFVSIRQYTCPGWFPNV